MHKLKIELRPPLLCHRNAQAGPKDWQNFILYPDLIFLLKIDFHGSFYYLEFLVLLGFSSQSP